MTRGDREGGMNELMRRLLWLPTQASTFAPKVDYLHYFVITVTMIASILTALLAFYFFFKYRARRAEPVDADRAPQREVRDRRHRRAAVLLPALVRAGLQGLHLVHDAAQEHDGRVRDGEEVDVEVRVRGRRPQRDRHAARPRQPPGPPADDQPRRAALVLRPRLPHQAGRAARPLHRDLVRGDQARPLPDPVRRVLRHLALADVGRGRGHAGRRVRRVDGRAEGGPRRARRHRRRRRRQHARLDRRVRQEDRDDRGLPALPLARRPAAHRPDLARPLPAARDAGERRGGRSPTRPT